ncbi:hypothetical protein H7B90_11055 [Cohnella xylanilytica]|uniref:Uncharacterized protein n=1 Tax=Cohnella xylanilytica TaxID=557555 RepID=A0A841TUI3_9BACL|nr:hypothetical protein [Cohnella xylanilytica]MBB6691936.1 hypothetical protein [Cohnella xylanilytica]
MKKRFKAALLASVSVMTIMGAQSAFANIGVIDRPGEAHVIPAIEFMSTAYNIDSTNDNDWFVWTNNTGKAKYLEVQLTSPMGKNLDYQIIQLASGGGIINKNSADNDAGKGGTEFLYLRTLPGDVVYFRVFAHTALDIGTAPYTFAVWNDVT